MHARGRADSERVRDAMRLAGRGGAHVVVGRHDKAAVGMWTRSGAARGGVARARAGWGAAEGLKGRSKLEGAFLWLLRTLGRGA